MFETIAESIDKKTIGLLGLTLDCDKNSLYINGEVKGNEFSVHVQNEYSLEVDVIYGPLERYKTALDKQATINYINTIIRDMAKINLANDKIIFENKRILFLPLPKVYIAKPVDLEVLGR